MIWMPIGLLFVTSIGADPDLPSPQRVPVKRVHSRHRRYIAPGATWTVLGGFEVIWDHMELRMDLPVHYRMDYLFGGIGAYLEAAGIGALGRKKRAASGDISSLIAAGGRSMDNLLIRSVATDQHNVFSAIGEAFNKAGLDGKQCVLRAVCELEETPVKHWSIIGDMVTTLLQPKRGDNTTLLEDYHRAQDIGADSAANGNKGDCWSFYPNCPLSLFNFIPDVYTKDDHIEIELDQSEMGSNTITDPDEIDKLLKLYPDVKPIDIDLDLTNM